MTPEEARAEVVRYWFSQAQESLESADSDQAGGRNTSAVNRAYYACFYAASAVLLKEGHTFKRHSGVRSAVHEHLVLPGRIDAALGGTYDRLFNLRIKADYSAFARPERDQVAALIEEARAFVAAIRKLAEPERV